MQTETILCDVLVIGGGLAGISAAQSAKARVPRVCLALKGRLGASGNSALAAGGFAAALADASDDGPDRHAADTLAGGERLNDPELVQILARGAPSAVARLDQLGVTFVQGSGGLARFPVPGHSRPRAAHTAGGGTAQMMEQLATTVRKVGVEPLEGVTILDLIVRGGTAEGAIGIRQDEGCAVRILSPAVVIACGGAGQLYPLTSNHPEVTGDGYAMAYRAGAALTDMEFVQFTPTALAHPPSLRGASPGGFLMAQPGARLLNRLGERFMQRYDAARMESTTRAIAARAIYREIAEGRGTEHGGVYLDVTEVAADIQEKIAGALLRRIRHEGVDPLKEPLELAPAVHHFMGGIAIDSDCRSTLPGLFAAGESAAGVHGANRLITNALSEAAVFGTIAGRAAAEHAALLGNRTSDCGTGDLLDFAEGLIGPAIPTEPLLQRLRAIMLKSGGLERERSGLETGLKELAELRPELDAATAGDPRAIHRLVELRNLLQVGELVLRSALARTESRGAHYRSDFPDRDDDLWLANLRIQRGAGRHDLELVKLAR